MHSVFYAFADPQYVSSVCPSVCLSVTIRYCVKTAKSMVGILCQNDSPSFLVSQNRRHEIPTGLPQQGS